MNICKGEITYVLRDAVTEEVIATETTTNIITEYWYNRIRDYFGMGDGSVIINGKALSSSRWLRFLPSNTHGNVCLLPSSNIPAIGTGRQYFPKSGSTPAYFQYSGRYNPPTVDRTIKTVALGIASQYWLDNSVNGDEQLVLAFARLNTPCVQTTTQVLDIYYRVFFPTNTTAELPTLLMNELFERQRYTADNYRDRWYTGSYGQMYSYHTIFPFRVPKLKSYDADRLAVSSQAHFLSLNRFWSPSTGATGSMSNPSTYGTRRLNRDFGFDELVGYMSTSVITGGLFRTLGQGDDSDNSADGNLNIFALAYNNLSGTAKIQNLIGHSTDVGKPITATPWLDVDNLPDGTGKIYLSGDWNNKSSPAVSGMYYKSVLPEWNTIRIKTDGQVSNQTATYTYTRQKFFGLLPITASPNAYVPQTIPAMCGCSPITGQTPGYGRRVTYDAGGTIIEDVTPGNYTTRQISASCRYDESSFIFVKKDKIILYNIGAADYWKYSAGYTNIHQVAVVNEKIYVACRDTGLYVIDPVNSDTVTSLASPDVGIDLSKCYGVAKGYADTLWAVGANGLMKFDGTTWTKYDATSTPAFSIAGISDNKWHNVEYLKVDELSATYQMFLVRRLDADVSQASFGVWWSTATVAANSFNDVQTVGMGRPRLNRTHFGGHDGMWVIANTQHKIMTFGGTPTAIGNNLPDNRLGDLYSSVFFVKNSTGQTCLMTMHDSSSQGTLFDQWNTVSAVIIKLWKADGTISETTASGVQTGLYVTANAGPYSFQNYNSSSPRARSTTDLNYGKNDAAASFILDKGVMMTVYCADSWVFAPPQTISGDFNVVTTTVCNYGLDFSISGGPLAYLAKTEYGWTGSAWDATVTTGKPVHADAQALADGVSVRFEDGAAGTSFRTPNYYKFGLCEGILKDNATRHNMQLSYYLRRAFRDNGDITAATVPAVTALPTGVVGLNLNLSSTDARYDATGFSNTDPRIYFLYDGGKAYAVGDKQVTGDFEISYSTADITLARANMNMTFGVGKFALAAEPRFGFVLYNGILYSLHGTTTANTNVALASVTSMKIKRVAGVLQLLLNGNVILTANETTTGIRAHDLRLDLLFANWVSSDPRYMVANSSAPITTILSNGSDNAVFVGNQTAGTGVFNKRFYGIDGDARDLNTIMLNSAAAVVKFTGVAPAVGEVTIDPWMGALYFNAADEGKSITASLTWQQSE